MLEKGDYGGKGMNSREQETNNHLVTNQFVNTDTILYEIAVSLGRIADMLAEMNRYIVDYDSSKERTGEKE